MDNINIKDINNEELLDIYVIINDFLKYLDNELKTQETIGDNSD